MPFQRILIAVDGSASSNRALEMGLELAVLTGAKVVGLTVEGPLPAYAATVGEIDEVKREQDAFFAGLVDEVRTRATTAGVPIDIEVRLGHAAELVVK